MNMQVGGLTILQRKQLEDMIFLMYLPHNNVFILSIIVQLQSMELFEFQYCFSLTQVFSLAIEAGCSFVVPPMTYYFIFILTFFETNTLQ